MLDPATSKVYVVTTDFGRQRGPAFAPQPGAGQLRNHRRQQVKTAAYFAAVFSKCPPNAKRIADRTLLA